MRNVKLTTYADSWIRKRIREALTEQSGPVRLPRYQRDKIRDVFAARRRRVLSRPVNSPTSRPHRQPRPE